MEARSHTAVLHTRLYCDEADICRYALQDDPYILAQRSRRHVSTVDDSLLILYCEISSEPSFQICVNTRDS